jgi:hypothetical protein
MDGKHDAVAEAVVAFPGVARDHQACALQDLALIVGKCPGQGLPVVGRIADAETRRDRSAQAPSFEVSNRPLRLLELQAIELGGLKQHTGKVEGLVAPGSRRRDVSARHLEACVAG